MRILIATLTAGAGHLAAAAALEETWRKLRPKDEIEKVDLLKFVNPLQRKLFSDGYVKLADRAPELWGFMFEKTDDVGFAKKVGKIRRLFPSLSRTRFGRYLKQFRPDVALCTHPLAVEMLGHLKAKDPKFAIFVTSIVTDFEAHIMWMEDCVDLYCVAAEETKARLVARGVSSKNVIVTGIPISAKFSSKIDRDSIRKNYHLKENVPVMLVLSGGFGMGPVAEILTELDKVSRDIQTIVVAGRNEELQKKLSRKKYIHPTTILGFSSNMHELMSVADVIVTKPGGLTTSESLAMGKPLFILNPIPGQEAANSDFLLEHGAAGKANRVEDLPFRIEQLLESNKLAVMANAAKGLGKPDAAVKVCENTLSRLKKS
jgi:processive 1,2-diacylglycerol beta-glucosyltransferase